MDSFIAILRNTHYFIMLLVLIFLVFTVGKFALKKSAKESFGVMEDKTTLIVMILTHIQLLIGLVLLFGGPMSAHFAHMGDVMKDSYLRLMVIEHPMTMVIGVILITIGRVRLKKLATADAKFKNILIFYSIALVLFLVRIPWNYING